MPSRDAGAGAGSAGARARSSWAPVSSKSVSGRFAGGVISKPRGEDRSIRPAAPSEAPLLSDLALRSKGSWGYDDAFLDACRTELTVTPADIATHPAYVLEVGGHPVGFYVLGGQPPEGELALLFVEPRWLRRGYGTRLWEHAVRAAATLGYASLLIESDPHAEPFYLARGARRVGSSASRSIPGRRLPLLRVDLRPADP